MPTSELAADQAAEEQAVAALLAGDDRPAIITYLRGCPPPYVHAIASGDGYICPAPGTLPHRLIPASEITVSAAARDAAARSDELRSAGPLVAAAAERIVADATIAAHTARKTVTGLYQAQGPAAARASRAEASA